MQSCPDAGLVFECLYQWGFWSDDTHHPGRENIASGQCVIISYTSIISENGDTFLHNVCRSMYVLVGTLHAPAGA